MNGFEHIFKAHITSRYGPWWIIRCQLPNIPLGAPKQMNDVLASGCAISWHRAALRAFGEAVERYSSIEAPLPDSLPQLRVCDGPLGDVLPRCSQSELLAAGIPSDPALDEVLHYPVNDPVSGNEYLVPINFVHLGFRGGFGTVWSRPNSNGLAASVSRIDSQFRAVFEVLERDAFMTRWHGGSPTVQITIDSGVKHWQLTRSVQFLSDLQIQSTFHQLDVDVPLHVIGCALRSSQFPRFVLGLGSGFSAEEAAMKALDEALSARVGVGFTGITERDWQINSDGIPRSVSNFADHAAYYANGNSAELVEKIFPISDPSSSRILLSEMAPIEVDKADVHDARFVSYCNILKERCGMTVLLADMTCADVRPNWFVTRAFIPEAIQLSQGTYVRWLGSPRLLRYVERHEKINGGLINHMPHPYA